MMSDTFIALRNASKRYGGVRALSGVDLALRKGEVHCLVGENGSGKSTLIKIMTGVIRPDPGSEIILEQLARTHLTPHEAAKHGIQVIYQDLSLFPNLTVAENICVSHYRDRAFSLARRRHMREAAEAVMARIGVGLDPHRRVGELSVAGRQLVAICRALAADAKLVIMDEPTASLARAEVDRLLRVVEELRNKQIGTLFVSHRLEEVKRVAERVTVVRDGARVGTFPAADVDTSRLSELMSGATFVHSRRPPLQDRRAPPVLSVRNLASHGRRRSVSFDLQRGEVLGIIGRLGSGRTTLGLTLFGMIQPSGGEIVVDGKSMRFASNRDAIAAGIAYLSEDRLNLGLVLPQSIERNIVVTTMKKLVGPLGSFRSGSLTGVAEKAVRDLAIRTPDVERPVGALSGGNQQRVALSKWLATGPAILILDSPTVGVDIAAKAGIYEIVADMARKGVGIILISDEIGEVLYQTNRILVMNEGAVTHEFDAESVTEQELEAAIDA